MGHSFATSYFLISTIPITLKIAFKIFKHIISSLPTTRRLVIKKDRIVHRAMVHPVVPEMGGAFLLLVDYFYARLIHLEIALILDIFHPRLVEIIKYVKRSEERRVGKERRSRTARRADK